MDTPNTTQRFSHLLIRMQYPVYPLVGFYFGSFCLVLMPNDNVDKMASSYQKENNHGMVADHKFSIPEIYYDVVFFFLFFSLFFIYIISVPTLIHTYILNHVIQRTYTGIRKTRNRLYPFFCNISGEVFIFLHNNGDKRKQGPERNCVAYPK